MFAFILKCLFLTNVLGHQEHHNEGGIKPEVRSGKIVGIYHDLNEAKLDLKKRRIHTVPFIKYHGNLG